jgi:hypothetical protein
MQAKNIWINSLKISKVNKVDKEDNEKKRIKNHASNN